MGSSNSKDDEPTDLSSKKNKVDEEHLPAVTEAIRRGNPTPLTSTLEYADPEAGDALSVSNKSSTEANDDSPKPNAKHEYSDHSDDECSSEAAVVLDDSLDVDTLLHIGSYLSAHDLVYSVGLVNRLFYSIAHDDSIWRSIVVVPGSIGELKFFARKHKGIRYIQSWRWVSEQTQFHVARKIGEPLPFSEVGALLPELQEAYVFELSGWPCDHPLSLKRQCSHPHDAAHLGALLRNLFMSVYTWPDAGAIESVAAKCVNVLSLTVDVSMFGETVAAAFPRLTSLTVVGAGTVTDWYTFVDAHPDITALVFTKGVTPPRGDDTLGVFTTLTILHAYRVTFYIDRLLGNNPGLTSVKLGPITTSSIQQLLDKEHITEFEFEVPDELDVVGGPVYEDLCEFGRKIRLKSINGTYHSALLSSLSDVTHLGNDWANHDTIISVGDRIRSLYLGEHDTSFYRTIAENAVNLKKLSIRVHDPEESKLLVPICKRVSTLELRWPGTELLAAAAGGGVCDDLRVNNAPTAVEAFLNNCKRRRLRRLVLCLEPDEVWEAVRHVELYVGRGGCIDICLIAVRDDSNEEEYETRTSVCLHTTAGLEQLRQLGRDYYGDKGSGEEEEGFVAGESDCESESGGGGGESGSGSESGEKVRASVDRYEA